MDAELGIQEAKELIELRHRGDGGFAATAGGSLFDGDGGRKSGDGIHVGFLKLFHKLAGIGVEAVEITALASEKRRSKARVLLPDPESPVTTTILF